MTNTENVFLKCLVIITFFSYIARKKKKKRVLMDVFWMFIKRIVLFFKRFFFLIKRKKFSLYLEGTRHKGGSTCILKYRKNWLKNKSNKIHHFIKYHNEKNNEIVFFMLSCQIFISSLRVHSFLLNETKASLYYSLLYANIWSTIVV